MIEWNGMELDGCWQIINEAPTIGFNNDEKKI